jgi:hypothetical protein
MALVLILRSESRGQFIAAVVAAGCFFGVSRSTSILGQLIRNMMVLGVIGLMTFYAWGLVEMKGDIRWNVEFMKEDFVSTRGDMYAKLLSYWWTSSPVRWLVGIGASASYDERVIGFYPHVIPVEVLGELGFIGIAWYLLILSIAVRCWLSLWHMHASDRTKRGIVAAMGAHFLFGFLLTLKQGTFMSHVGFMMSMMLIFRYEAVSRQAAVHEKAKRAYYWWWQSQMARSQPSPVMINPA